MGARTGPFSVEAAGLTLELDSAGRIVGCKVLRSSRWNFSASTQLAGLHDADPPQLRRRSGGGVEIRRRLADGHGHEAELLECFSPTQDSIRWEIEITSQDAPWSTAITSSFQYAASPESRFWTTWGHPDNQATAWADPLAWQAFAPRTWNYQFDDWSQVWKCKHAKGDPRANFISIPMFTIAEPHQDAALTFMQSPEDVLLNMTLSEDDRGAVSLRRDCHRLGGGRAVKFSMDLTAHPADVRAGLGWVVNRYPAFFNPGNPRAHELSGSSAYSGNENPVDVAALRKMGFAYNWKLSDDFPYMGMFLPPLGGGNRTWQRSCAEPAPPGKGRETSASQMNDYARYMRSQGFHVLSYFNVTEYGKDMPWPIPPRQTSDDQDLWKNPVDYLYHGGRAAAVLMNGDQPCKSNCYGAVIVDPGEPAYLQHLVDQVRRNNEWLPQVDGICIDRLDWLGHYNDRGDDGVSWVNGKPARSLFRSWQTLCDRIVPELHRQDKLLFLNNCQPRIDVVGRGDGIFAEWATEFFELPSYINYAALAGVNKPAGIWTCKGEVSDFYFQRCLYLGLYPVAPYPSNNHCLTPEAESGGKVKNLYAKGKEDEFLAASLNAASPEGFSLAYGPLLQAMRGKNWVLRAHCVESPTPGVKVNLFSVPGGWALPVCFGGEAKQAVVRLQGVEGLKGMSAVALHPGIPDGLPLKIQASATGLELSVPLVRGCAMVQLRQDPRESQIDHKESP
ncbi:MAG: hypothetical protein RL095_3653 [Verrucomicrobiota bacterium]|jgi:hypothetical protein